MPVFLDNNLLYIIFKNRTQDQRLLKYTVLTCIILCGFGKFRDDIQTPPFRKCTIMIIIAVVFLLLNTVQVMIIDLIFFSHIQRIVFATTNRETTVTQRVSHRYTYQMPIPLVVTRRYEGRRNHSLFIALLQSLLHSFLKSLLNSLLQSILHS